MSASAPKPSKYFCRGAPGANSMSMEAAAPESFWKACRPPGGTNKKSPAVASAQFSPL
ncbi:Uncharacterised protein [Mycobacteroides abscessus subsp. abscessus]|nr:Uncharacterised protein [Mycobacteroides abscessus subsp. abscessus]